MGIAHPGGSLPAAQDVDHDGAPSDQSSIAQRPPQDCPQVLLKLGRRTGLNGVVAGVVRPGGHLVHQQLTASQQEHLHAKDARPCSRSQERFGPSVASTLKCIDMYTTSSRDEAKRWLIAGGATRGPQSRQGLLE